tara:strand:+ start:281 stop:658 length:378 start_codon:yes stop_codon:yes gene_type:complete
MIFGLGCDIVDHSVVEMLNWAKDERFLNRTFTSKEIDLFNDLKNTSFLAGRFAAKEATLKALGIGLHDGISMKEIEILKSETGSPYVNLRGELKIFANEQGITTIHISLSHTIKQSTAYVILEKL